MIRRLVKPHAQAKSGVANNSPQNYEILSHLAEKPAFLVGILFQF